MTHRSMLMRHTATTAPVVAYVPYPVPSAAPWNAFTYLWKPQTPDSTGAAVHPDVVDFKALGLGTWNGHRYWMACTPYYNANGNMENPVVYVSEDAVSWVTPTGAFPAYLFTPSTPSTTDYSDTDLVYDSLNNRLVLMFREYQIGTPFNEWVYASTSTNGTTWSGLTTLFQVGTQGQPRDVLSPALVKTATGWSVFVCKDFSLARYVRANTNVMGAFTGPTVVSRTGDGASALWHIDVIREPVSNELWGLFNYQWDLRPAVSTDEGLNWTVGPSLVDSRTGEWDAQVYRGTMQFDPVEPTKMQVWYSAFGYHDWRLGFTKLPRSAWDLL